MIYSQNKILGMLWGLHAGDSLGAPLEFLPASPRWNFQTEIVGGGKFNWKAGEATDDTDLMLCLLRSIENPHSFSFDNLKQEMLAWFDSQPPDIGTTTIRGLRNLKENVPLRECGYVDEKFQGNGSLMRVAPLSLLANDATGVYQGQKTAGLKEIMETQTKMTHGHQHCVDCDRVFVATLQATLKGASKEQIYEAALAEARSISEVIYLHIKEIPWKTWENLPTSGYCVETLCAGIWAFLKYNSFEDSVVAVVNRGDDSDSCGAVAGALCGAFYGVSGVPERWLEKLEFREHIAEVLEKLSK